MNTADYNNGIEICHDALSFIGHMVDKYGDVLGLDSSKSIKERLPEYHHDYFYFCLTKATRSLLAANELASMKFREDAMILARSAYETYLLIANVIKSEQFVDNAILISLMLTTGEAKYLKLKDGRINFRRVHIKGTDEVVSHDMSVSTLSKTTFSRYDRHIHKEAYKYLSEFQHGDFISSGNYRTEDDKKYDVEPKNLYLDIHLTITYLIYLLLQSMHLEYSKYGDYSFNEIAEVDITELKVMHSEMKVYLHTLIDELNFNDRHSSFINILIQRIDENVCLEN